MSRGPTFILALSLGALGWALLVWLNGVYGDPAVMPVQWYRDGVRSAVEQHERAQGWGTFNG